ncbi:MAG: 23S rRNA (pseudouridine(1915)-N(3))-methyltransferase RlmH, partial [Oscillospiraceae bacterium]|nr:23S rRNA (pseudouridine(1915)-N(3))-methyltransferase RlmH [Oscillospiraceae bacterium]
MLINIISLGRLKDKWIKDGCAEYIKMLGAYCTVKETELTPVRLPDEPNVKLIQSALDAEAEMILAAVPKGSAVIALCIEGQLMSSEA